MEQPVAARLRQRRGPEGRGILDEARRQAADGVEARIGRIDQPAVPRAQRARAGQVREIAPRRQRDRVRGGGRPGRQRQVAGAAQRQVARAQRYRPVDGETARGGRDDVPRRRRQREVERAVEPRAEDRRLRRLQRRPARQPGRRAALALDHRQPGQQPVAVDRQPVPIAEPDRRRPAGAVEHLPDRVAGRAERAGRRERIIIAVRPRGGQAAAEQRATGVDTDLLPGRRHPRRPIGIARHRLHAVGEEAGKIGV